jgi:hypothetical protein
VVERGDQQHPCFKKIRGFFFRCALPLSEVRKAAPIVKETRKNINQRRELFAALRQLRQKSPINFTVLAGNGTMFNRRRRLGIKKNIFNATVPGQCPMINTIFTRFCSLWTLPLSSIFMSAKYPVSVKNDLLVVPELRLL